MKWSVVRGGHVIEIVTRMTGHSPVAISRDRLKLLDFTPLEREHQAAVQLDVVMSRFAIDDAGHIVKLYIRDKFTDVHADLALSLTRLKQFSALNHPHSAAGVSDCGMAELLSHPALEDVTYQGNQKLTGAFFNALRPGSSITRIGVPFCPIDDASLALADGCSLTHISLRGSQVSDDSIDTLASMRSLQQVHVKQTRVTRIGVERLRNLLPGCWIDMLDRPHDG
ncbi:hypothetical protein [Rhodopirellula sp. MGV]|uniref:hypothetical protein n=1 Tax=Rhodopirellula sp. MGV TaxID=2023130 RepID=UPI000B9785DC|nr:hypothetical protein [Rhodopirellula sp. MGV]OYP34314.1 hypothetical protein CGZ80_14715 [Rhodopirellula sp. MGV]PNY36075.1 hypothetical protein C2E31_14860 [Rhodopirellula baltica]